MRKPAFPLVAALRRFLHVCYQYHLFDKDVETFLIGISKLFYVLHE